MKIYFDAVGETRHDEIISYRKSAVQYLTEHGIENQKSGSNTLRIPANSFVQVELNTVQEIQQYCKQYSAFLQFNGVNAIITFIDVEDSEL